VQPVMSARQSTRLRIWGLEVRVFPGAPGLALGANAVRVSRPRPGVLLPKPSHGIPTVAAQPPHSVARPGAKRGQGRQRDGRQIRQLREWQVLGRKRKGSSAASWTGKLPFTPSERFGWLRPKADAKRRIPYPQWPPTAALPPLRSLAQSGQPFRCRHAAKGTARATTAV
jgi:hypothetical protein